MTKQLYRLYNNLAKSDAKVIRRLQGGFEDILGMKVDDDLFNAMYINARYMPEYSTIPGIPMKPLYLKSKGALPLAGNFLYKQFSRNHIDLATKSKDCLNIVNKINEQGFCVVENFLSADEVEKVKKQLADFIYYSPSEASKEYNLDQIRKADNSRASTFQSKCTGSDIAANSSIGRLMIEPYMADIASSYFQTQAYLTQGVAFYTRAKDPKLFTPAEIHGSAQKWHIDYSDFRFLKFFLYLTDVEPGNGQHTFVANSHEKGYIYPKTADGFHQAGFRVYSNGELDGLVKDEWVNNNVEKSRIKEFCCPKGTLIIENTSGLHKGGDCFAGTREMLAFTYAISNFGCIPDMPTLDYTPTSAYHTHVVALLKNFKEEQMDKMNIFEEKPTIKSRIKGKIKTLLRV